jgi:putative membrane protein
MGIAADIAVAAVGLLHLMFLVLEMFLWTKPFGRRVFGLSPELAAASAPLAKNQGLYNGFLAAGLFWAMFRNSPDIALFFLGCVIVAGIFGAITAKRSILWVQALPGAIAMALVLWEAVANRPL